MNHPKKNKTEQKKPPNIFFRLTAITTTIFIITILGLTATIFGDPAAPIQQFFNQYGGLLIAIEAAISLFTGLLALAIDRRHIIENQAPENQAPRK